MNEKPFNIQGLNDAQVHEARMAFGENLLKFKKENKLWLSVKSIAKEPMVLMLLLASVIYFISGKTGDGIFLSAAIVLVAGISLFQDSRSRSALEKLKNFTQPRCKVIRNGNVLEIKTEELVMGDSLMVEEGSTIAADGKLVHSHDFSVNESILTGESFAVEKNPTSEIPFIFKGTNVTNGLAIATITAIGNETRLGKIGQSLEQIEEEKTPLELQIGRFVKRMVIFGAAVFVLVWGIHFYTSHNWLGSLLKALTLAMSILPEEIPVAFTTFMALGAWRMMKMGVVVKQMKTVETLGSATVICTDKTGTITENKMSLAKVNAAGSSTITDAGHEQTAAETELVRIAMWASEPVPFDPMEIALHDAYSLQTETDERNIFTLIHEYPLGGKPPMMTHVFEQSNGTRIIAAKGAPEALMQVSRLSETEKTQIIDVMKQLASEGFRILGVAEAVFEGDDYPEFQQDFSFEWKGLVAFYDPPKKNIRNVLNQFYAAGIDVKIVTGDNAITTSAIARQIGFRGADKAITGDELMALTDAELKEKVKEVMVYTRMFPEAKLRIINALKANHEIVAMTGDGVNDGPALKAAHIGIAMGKKGSGIAREAASLVLMEDDLAAMVDAVAMGRRIYTNLKKAIQYIISIHIPIILTVFIPLALGWIYPDIFSPVHIIFLELIMGPTCSIIYENEPMEKNTMLQKPRPFQLTFFNWNELTTSILQGLMITAGTLSAYLFAVSNGYSEMHTRSVVFVVLISANIFLTLVNRSFFYSIFTTMRYKNNLVLLINSITITLTASIIYIHPVSHFFAFEALSLSQLGISIAIGFVSVIWFEGVKFGKRCLAK